MKISLWGVLSFAAITLITGIFLRCFGSQIGFRPSGYIAITVGFPANTLVRVLRIADSQTLKVLKFMNGYVFAALVNAIVGAIVFGTYATVLQLIRKKD